MSRSQAIAGLLLGTAVGDALGLPAEGLSCRRAARLFGAGPVRHRFVFGRGMCSDDTEHACMTAQALLASRADPPRFARSLGWRLRGWLIALPAGVGLATGRAVLKLWVGFPPSHSGVWSAGNGPCMRSPLLGVCARNSSHLADLVRASTRLTHADPAAERGAFAVAAAARLGAEHGPAGVSLDRFVATFPSDSVDPALRDALPLMRAAIGRGADVASFAADLGLARGVGGYVNHTVPVALYCWLRYPGDYAAGVTAAVRLGGDTDTVAAIVGGLLGATNGPDAIPAEWLGGLAKWPRTVRWMRRLAAAGGGSHCGGGRLADIRRPAGLTVVARAARPERGVPLPRPAPRVPKAAAALLTGLPVRATAQRAYDPGDPNGAP
ncbi:MAG: ADP-ribosylglycohydrolase [Phycisphaerales bacterium]|nr:ADP-ribosylglycohydrolase [Phycisphaerales bacterium]